MRPLLIFQILISTRSSYLSSISWDSSCRRYTIHFWSLLCNKDTFRIFHPLWCFQSRCHKSGPPPLEGLHMSESWWHLRNKGQVPSSSCNMPCLLHLYLSSISSSLGPWNLVYIRKRWSFETRVVPWPFLNIALEDPVIRNIEEIINNLSTNFLDFLHDSYVSAFTISGNATFFEKNKLNTVFLPYFIHSLYSLSWYSFV